MLLSRNLYKNMSKNALFFIKKFVKIAEHWGLQSLDPLWPPV